MSSTITLTMSSSTILSLARVIASEDVDCQHKPTIMSASERMDALYDLYYLLDEIDAPRDRLRQMEMIMSDCKEQWHDDLAKEYWDSVEVENEKSATLREMEN